MCQGKESVKACGGAYLPYGVVVLTVTDGAISRITAFGEPGPVTAFGFPATVDSEQ